MDSDPAGEAKRDQLCDPERRRIVTLNAIAACRSSQASIENSIPVLKK